MLAPLLISTVSHMYSYSRGAKDLDYLLGHFPTLGCLGTSTTFLFSNI